ncbi:MAG: hypothetical protein K6F55_07495, partial [Eubacterium sp.]|nr:hypothetical protein [Eubacterium sp.]
MSEQRSYLNTKIINKNRSKAMAQLIIGITLTVFYSFAFVSMAEGNYPVKNTPLILVLMVPTVYLIWCGYQNKKYVKMAEGYNKIFASDNDGFITAAEMEKKTNKKYFDIFL